MISSHFIAGRLMPTPAIAAGSLIGILKARPDANLIWAEDYGIHILLRHPFYHGFK